MTEIQILDGPCGERDREHGKRGKRGPTGPTGPGGGGESLIAAASIGSSGTELSGFGFASVSHAGTGLYDLTLAAPPADVDIIPVVTLFGFTGFYRVSGVGSGVIQVQIFTTGEVAADANFFIHVASGA